MKNIFKIIPISALVLSLASCTEAHFLPYEVEMPTSVADQQVINAYDDLKTYVDREENPNFKLGVGISMDDFNSKGVKHRLTNKNFDEITLSSSMNHGSIVRADGSLNLGPLNGLFEVTTEANMSVFGSALCWHSNQNANYLESLIAPVVVPGGDEPIESGYSLKFSNQAVVDFYVVQTVHDITPTDANAEYIIKFAAKGSKAGTISADLQATSNYSGNGFGNIALTTVYKEYELRVTTTAARNRFIFNHGQYDGTVFIDNFTLRKAGTEIDLIGGGDFEVAYGNWNGWGPTSLRGRSLVGEGFGGFGGSTINKTPEEMKSIITEALDTWITGVVTASKPYVKAWDVVNEPMDDANPYQLKTAVGRGVLPVDQFFWQDYLGKDYAVEAFRLARASGNTGDKLFISDSGLESNIDKCKGLIEYVDYIESKGQTVDGIGAKMHLTINSDKEDIESMFQLLAATGKQIKISELDVALALTPAPTANDFKLQADMYKFVVDKYMQHIPASQRYGITLWNVTDVNGTTGSAAGLFNSVFTRKPSYASFAEGLKGM